MAKSSRFTFEISQTAAEFADDAIGTLEAGTWETWQDEDDVPADEEIPKLEVYHPAVGWMEPLSATPANSPGSLWRLVCGSHGARALVNAADDLKSVKKAAKEDGPAAMRQWQRLATGARALVAKIEDYAAPNE